MQPQTEAGPFAFRKCSFPNLSGQRSRTQAWPALSVNSKNGKAYQLKSLPPEGALRPMRGGVQRWTGIWPARIKPIGITHHVCDNQQTGSAFIVTEISSSRPNPD